MTPMPGEMAQTWHRRLTLLYIFFAWNAGGLALYGYLKDRQDETKIQDKTNAHYWGRTLGINHAKIVKVSPQGIETYDFDREKYLEQVTPKPKKNIQPVTEDLKEIL